MSQGDNGSFQFDDSSSATVVIVTYNNVDTIEECLNSLRALKVRPTDIIVIDNASTDGTHELLKNWSDVKLISMQENAGFAAAANIGIAEAGTELVAILNPDTVVAEEWLSSLIGPMKENENAGACQSTVLLHDRPSLINTDGNMLHFLGFAWVGNYGSRYIRSDGWRNIGYPSGCSMMIRKSAFNKVGMFENFFFMYHDDIDLGARMRLSGREVILGNGSIVYHKYRPEVSHLKLYYAERNRWFLLLRIFRLRTLLLMIPVLSIAELGVIIASVSGGWWRIKIKGYLSILGRLNEIARSRAEIAKIRTISDRQLWDSLTGTLPNHLDIPGPIMRILDGISRYLHKKMRAVI